ncbi:MAG: glycosyl hydrolase family protein, partial [Spirochaetales bacterium]
RDPEAEGDQLAAQNYDGYFNRWFLDPLVGRGYPQDMVDLYGELAPEPSPGDLEIIAQPLDFIGVNYYNANWYVWDADAAPLHTRKQQPDGLWHTGDRDVYPPGLYAAVERLWKDYTFESIYITENGASFEDTVEYEGAKPRIHDAGRVRFLNEHFEQAARLLDDGAPLRGYFVWSLMDNFEWAAGYSIRYGIYYTDYKTQERIPKDSALWYRDFITEA